MFKPAQPWNDTDGNPIHAHGGSVHFFDDAYYWYGENKRGCSNTVKSNPWHAGVNCYRSTNLYDWTFEGTVLPASDDPNHDLHGFSVMDRPHVVYNLRTRQYMMWMKIVKGRWDKHQATGIAVADRPTGPFKYVRSFLPAQFTTGDANFFLEDRKTSHGEGVGSYPEDPALFVQTPKAYWIFGTPHRGVVVADLTEEYLDTTGMYSFHLPRPGTPEGREAPVVVYHGWQYHIITSGTTGYNPNAALYCTADFLHGEWTEHGNPCRGPNAEKTFGGQFGSAFEVADRPGCWIGVADLWTPDDIERSGYIWLPFQFENGRLRIDWYDEWDLSVFDELR